MRRNTLSPPTIWQQVLAMAAAYAVGVGPAFEDVSPEYLAAAHGLGLDVHPYTVNEEPDMLRLTGLCMDGMFTNFPDRLRLVRSRSTSCPH